MVDVPSVKTVVHNKSLDDILDHCFSLYEEEGLFSVIVIDRNNPSNILVWSIAPDKAFFGTELYIRIYESVKKTVLSLDADESTMDARIRTHVIIKLCENRNNLTSMPYQLHTFLQVIEALCSDCGAIALDIKVFTDTDIVVDATLFQNQDISKH